MSRKSTFHPILIFLFVLVFTNTRATEIDTVAVDVNLDVKHIVGEISSFDRAKFVTIHADVTEQEWTSGTNAVPDFMDDFLNGYDVYLGRNTGGITWWLNNIITEDPNRPGFADSMSVKQSGQSVKNGYAAKTNLHPYELRNDQIICAQLHPFWPDGKKTQKGWALSQTDNATTPFGTATGEYMGRFIRDFFGNGGTLGQPRPNLVEVVNEPLWELVTNGTEDPAKIFRFHNSVASEIKKLNSDIQVGGFCDAFPDLEKNSFQEWEERWKLFMDVSGENMDFWSIHLYDFPAFNGLQRYRKGAQMEATLDMMEHYSYLKFGEAKPFLVSEFGAQTHDYNNIWSPYRDWLHMKSANAMMLQFMDRPQLVTKLINYIMLKAEWGYNASTGKTWASRLMRKANEPESYTGEWVYTDMVKMFQLWADVKGTRVDSKANNIDVLNDSYVDGNKIYVLICNLDLENSKQLKINLLGSTQQVQEVKIRQLKLVGDSPEMIETNFTDVPESIEIAPEGTLVVEYTANANIQIDETSAEKKYYATEYLKPIIGNQTLVFEVMDVEYGQNGEAILRLGIGREHGKEIFPEVKINGTTLKVPSDYKGDDQQDRLTFFGVLEIDVPYDLIQSNNTINIKFPDSGGYVSSVALRTYKFSREIKRFQDVISGISNTPTKEIMIYPNPAQNEIRIINQLSNEEYLLEIYSVAGAKILSEMIWSEDQPVSISNLPNGLYTVKASNKKKVSCFKLIVKK